MEFQTQEQQQPAIRDINDPYSIITQLIKVRQIKELEFFLQNKDIPIRILNSLFTMAIENFYMEYDESLYTIQLLLNKGANVDTPIYYSRYDINVSKNSSVTPLMLSLMFEGLKNYSKLFSLLIKYNPDVKIKDIEEKDALYYFFKYNKKDDSQILITLIKLGADVNSEYDIIIDEDSNDKFQGTYSVLTIAAKYNMANCVKVLCESGADVHYKVNPIGQNAMSIAAANNNQDIALYLFRFEQSINNNMNNNNMTPIPNNNPMVPINNNPMTPINSNPMTPINSNPMTPINNNPMTPIGNNPMTPIGNNPMVNMNNNMTPINNNMANNTMPMNNKQNKKDGDVFMVQQIFSKNQTKDCILELRNAELTERKRKKRLYNYYNVKNKNGQNFYKDTDLKCYMEIPFEFHNEMDLVKDHKNMNQQQQQHMKKNVKLNNVIKILQTPVLNLDLSKTSFELEKKINQKKEELETKKKQIAELKEKLGTIVQNQKNLSDRLNSRNLRITGIKTQLEKTQKRLEEIVRENECLKEILDRRKESTLLSPNNKQLTPRELRELKFHKVYYDSDFLVNCLEKDLKNYEAYITAVIETKKPVAEKLITQIKDLVHGLTENYECELYGSYTTGLCLPWSDLDFVIISKPGQQTEQYFLKRVYNSLALKPWVNEIKLIENTFVPLIKVKANSQYLDFNIDISMQAERHQGLKCVQLVKMYLQEYKVLHPLVLALKTLLKNANLNNPYSGGLSSYGLILMLVSYIQSKLSDGAYPYQENNLSKTFIGFLSHFGLFFDYGKYIIIAYPPNDIGDTNDNDNDKENTYAFGSNSHDFIIVDPLNKGNNVAKSTFQYMNIKRVFMIAFLISKEDCECGCHYGKAKNENEIFETEHCILKRMFNSAKLFVESNLLQN